MSASVRAAMVEAAWLSELRTGTPSAAAPRPLASLGARWQAGIARDRLRASGE